MAPQNAITNFLISLYERGALLEASSVETTIPEHIVAELERMGRVKTVQSPARVWLTDLGFLIADGARLLRDQERKNTEEPT